MVERRSFNQVNQTLAGAGAGLVASVVTCPLDVVKTRLQNQYVPKGVEAVVTSQQVLEAKKKLESIDRRKEEAKQTNRYVKINPKEVKEAKETLYRGTLPSLRRIWFEEGIPGLYRGLGPTLLGYLPTWTIYFVTYDYFKANLAFNLNFPESSTGIQMLSAMGAGATSTLVTSPFWVIKTRLMTQNEFTTYKYRGTLDAFQNIFNNEGFKGFYKGLTPSLLGVSHVIVQFPLYEHLKSYLTSLSSKDRTNNHSLQLSSIVIASSISKMVASCVTYPHEVIRTRLQNQNTKPYKYKGVFHTFQIILKEEGYRGLYRGLVTNLIRTAPASALTLLTYELILHNLPS